MVWDSCICIDFIESRNSSSFVIEDHRKEYFEALNKIWERKEAGLIETIFVSTLAMTIRQKVFFGAQASSPATSYSAF